MFFDPPSYYIPGPPFAPLFTSFSFAPNRAKERTKLSEQQEEKQEISSRQLISHYGRIVGERDELLSTQKALADRLAELETRAMDIKKELQSRGLV